HRAHRTEAFERVGADPAVQAQDLRVVQAAVGLGHRHQRIAIPQAEGVVGVQRAAAAVAGLRVDQHRIDGERVDLPLPPVAAPASGLVRGVAALYHHALDSAFARVLGHACLTLPAVGVDHTRCADERVVVRYND